MAKSIDLKKNIKFAGTPVKVYGHLVEHFPSWLNVGYFIFVEQF